MTSGAELAGSVEISEDRAWTSIALAGFIDDGLRVDLVDYLAGVGSAVARIEELHTRYRVGAWAIDPSSPAGSLLLPLTARGVTLIQPTARDVAAACGTFLDMVRDGTVKAGRSAALRESVRVAQDRRLAGGLAWERKGGVNAGPMMAASLALWAATNYAGLGPDDVFVG